MGFNSGRKGTELKPYSHIINKLIIIEFWRYSGALFTAAPAPYTAPQGISTDLSGRQCSTGSRGKCAGYNNRKIAFVLPGL